jgi:adenosylcobinamide-GDP ribazoletransferase
MKILKSIAVAFSMYSRIPMPRFTWDSDDMTYHLIFFPWVGAVIGLLEYGLFRLYVTVYLPAIAVAAFAIALPLLVTGGYHVDGFMDVSDALSSWQPKEKRLEIMKDPHIGAFSVINLVTFGLILYASIILMTEGAFETWCFSFFVSRCLSGMCVVAVQKAKEDGMAAVEAKNSHTKAVFYGLLVQLIICYALAFLMNPLEGVMLVVLSIFWTLVYLKRARVTFGGITGDLAGWFVVSMEIVLALFLMGMDIYQRISL